MGVHDSAGRAKHYLFYVCTSRTPQIDRNTLKPKMQIGFRARSLWVLEFSLSPNPQSREVLRPKKLTPEDVLASGVPESACVI